MVSLEFGLAEQDKGPVLDESLPRSINKTVRQFLISLTRVSLGAFKCYLASNSEQRH